MAARRRVAITGLGLVTPVGNDVAATWAALLACKSGGAAISLFDASGFPVRIAAEVKGFDPAEAIGRSLLTRRHDIRGYATSVHTACASGGQAIGTALKLIRRGAVDYALAGGFDSMISPVGIAGFCLLSALSVDNEMPERASRPF